MEGRKGEKEISIRKERKGRKEEKRKEEEWKRERRESGERERERERENKWPKGKSQDGWLIMNEDYYFTSEQARRSRNNRLTSTE